MLKSSTTILLSLTSLFAVAVAASSCGENAVCGDRECSEGESLESCAVDCDPAACGNGKCDEGECGVCTKDCAPADCEVCGNGACLPEAEDCKSCEADCGKCLACGTSKLSDPQPNTQSPACDFFDTSHCLLPFPSNFFTTPDPTSKTKLRINFPASEMPTNNVGVPISVAELNRADGFSPGSVLVTRVLNLSLENSRAPLVTSMSRSLDRDSPIVVIDAETGERQTVWAEYDAQATASKTQAIIVRPARNYKEGRRYIVAMRSLRDANGGAIEPKDEFRVYRDCIETADPAIEGRRETMNEIFATLAKHGIAQKDLYVAWDFTVASQDTLAGRLLHMRDRAFAKLPDSKAPNFTITSIEEKPAEFAFLQRIVKGNFPVPSFITPNQIPSLGGRFVLGSNGLPTEMPLEHQATFTCIVPKSVLQGDGTIKAGTAALYGHQVLSNQEELLNANVQKLAFEHGFTFCATDWIGMSEADQLSILSILLDISNFPTLSDRVQQAMLNFMFLGRLMKSPTGLTSHPAFRAGVTLQPVFSTERITYFGEGQGGTIGGALLAVSKEIEVGAFNVSGINYTTLLTRSQDFAPYQGLVNDSYPNELDRAVLYPLMQMLWDRAEVSGYAEHLTGNPYDAETPKKRVLIHEAFGDHVVANVVTEWLARSLDAKLVSPALESGRSLDKPPFFGLEKVASFPHEGSAIVVWDNGTVPAPPVNLPPTEGVDPHGAPGETPAARKQIAEFLKSGGKVIDVCGGQPCKTE